MNNEDKSFPELVEGVVDAATLHDLVRDLQTLTTIDEIQLKGGAQSHGERANIDLSEAVTLLIANKLRGLQIRYRWEGVGWIDTLLCTPEGIRIIRTKAPA
jgi:hypothetical protein